MEGSLSALLAACHIALGAADLRRLWLKKINE